MSKIWWVEVTLPGIGRHRWYELSKPTLGRITRLCFDHNVKCQYGCGTRSYTNITLEETLRRINGGV